MTTAASANMPRAVDGEELAQILEGRRSGDGWTARCPSHPDRTPSLSVSEGQDETTLIHCHAGCSQEAVIAALASQHGVRPRTAPSDRATQRRPAPSVREVQQPKANRTIWRAIQPIPEDSPKITAHPKHGQPALRWAYRDAGNRVLGLICRFDTATGKAVLPIVWAEDDHGNRAWRWQAFPVPRPLYSLHFLAQKPDYPVVVVEGEKAADAAQKLLPHHVVTTWPGGSSAVAMADWSPMSGRRIWIWPDADPPGDAAAQGAARQCLDAGAAEVHVIEPPTSASKGWDAADAQLEGWSTAKVKALLATGEEVENRLKLPVLSVAQLMGLELPERPRLLPWLAEGGLVLIFGPRGIGKTYFTLGLAASLVMGETFIRWPVTKPVGVLVVDGEMQLTNLRERIASLLPSEPKAPLEVLSHEYVYHRVGHDMDLGAEEWQAAIKSHLETRPEIKVIIIDNLSCLLPSIREDKRDDWATKVLPFLIWLRRRCIAVVMVHHAGKGGDQRGTSSREDQLDVVIRLDSVPGHDATSGAQFRVRFTKARSCFGDEVGDIEVRLETPGGGTMAWSWQPVEESNETRLLNLVMDGIDNVRDAAEELNITKGAVSKLKNKLVAKGRLKPGRNLVLADG